MEIKCQLDATEVFIAHIACSTCFGHHYAHHQELKSIIQYYTVVAACGISCCKDVKSNFVSYIKFVFSILSVVCFLVLL